MDPRIQTVINLVESDFGRDLALEQMAQLVNLSSPRLRHLCKAETGTTPTRRLHAVRMQSAKELLATFLSVKEIMVRVGCHDESHFVRDFKRTWGATPLQYRNAHRDFLVRHGTEQH